MEMGQFKPMVKMMTTEPTVELKLKKGGSVEKKMQMGGTPSVDAPRMPTRGGMPSGAAMPGTAPMKPSMAARRRAMMARPGGAAPAAPIGRAAAMMKKGGEAHEDAAQDRAMIKKAMSGKKFATGGVVMGQGGYATGGIIKSEMGKSKITTAHPDNSPAKTGEVKMGNGGGYKHGGGVKMYAKGGGVNGNVSTTPPGVSGTTTGSVKKGNAGGYKTGGAAKKFADGGAVQSDGRAVKMPQGNKRPSAPVSINQLSGTFKKGGSVKKFSTGGLGETEKRLLREAQEEKLDRKGREAFENVPKVQKELDEAMNPMSMMKEMAGKVKKLFTGSEVPRGSVTKTEKSVTVAPGKKRGGAC